MGKNFALINDLFFHYLPYFNRFRTPNSVLSVTTIFIPVMAGLGLQGLINLTAEERKQHLKSLYLSTGIVAGACALLAILGPSMFSFSHATADANYAQIIDALLEQRQSMLSLFGMEIMFYRLAAAGVLWFYIKNIVSTSLPLVYWQL